MSRPNRRRSAHWDQDFQAHDWCFVDGRSALATIAGFAEAEALRANGVVVGSVEERVPAPAINVAPLPVARCALRVRPVSRIVFIRHVETSS